MVNTDGRLTLGSCFQNVDFQQRLDEWVSQVKTRINLFDVWTAGGRDRKQTRQEKQENESLTFSGANEDLFGRLRYDVLKDIGRVSVVSHQFGQKTNVANG